MRVGMAAVAMVLVAEGAVWLLRPGDRPIDPTPVSEGRYFTAAEIDARPRLQRRPAVALRRRPRRPGGRTGQLGARQAGRGPPSPRATGGPTAARGRGGGGRPFGRPRGRGPAGRDRRTRAGGRLRDLDPGTGLLARRRRQVGGIGAAAVGGGRGAPARPGAPLRGRWWLPGTVVVAAVAVVFVWLAPVVLAPLFNRFTPLAADSRARAEVLSLARRAGVDVGEVYRVDASRRVRSLNAYVDGIGSTRRVVLYDNLLRRANRPELRSVVAHELGHVKHDDVPRGLAFLIIVTPLGLLFTRGPRGRAGGSLRGRSARPGRASRLPARAGGGRPGPRGPRQPALTPGGGERRHLRPPADARPARPDRGPASPRRVERRRPGSPGRRHGPDRHSSLDDRPDRRRRRLRRRGATIPRAARQRPAGRPSTGCMTSVRWRFRSQSD